MRVLLVSSVVVFATVLAVGCNKPAEQAPLPPTGLAGAPGTGAPVGTGLPGAGAQLGSPTGAPGAALPAGHPPIGQAMAAPGNPMDHSNRPDAPAGPHGGTGGAGGAALGLPGAGGAAAAPGGAVTLTGTVAEALDVTEYTYMRLKMKAGGEEWVAIPKTQIAVGDTVVVNQSIVMNNFPSKSLNRTFDKLTMGMLVGSPQKAAN